MKKTPVSQLVDCEAYEEHFDIPNGAFTRDVKRFEADIRRSKTEKEPVYVGVVSVARCYGGPEEGGWYYDWHQVEEILKCNSFRCLLATVRTMREQYPPDRFGRYSAAGGRDFYIYMSRDKRLIENQQTTERPRYE